MDSSLATLENVNHQPMIFAPSLRNSVHDFIPDLSKKLVESFPQIYFSCGMPWHEANRYAFFRYYDLQKDIKTIRREMTHLAKYADWLEESSLHWLHFPKQKSERCLFRFRGLLIEQRNEGLLASSTTSQAMNAVVAFYRWASANGYAGERSTLFENRSNVITFFDHVGFRRTMSAQSTELSIPNRVRTGIRLEEGLTPISQANSQILMAYLAKYRNYELYLMAKVALQTGCRHETIATLKIDAIKNAYSAQTLTNIMKIMIWLH